VAVFNSPRAKLAQGCTGGDPFGIADFDGIDNVIVFPV
jgi:hypothetical protein